MRVCECLCVCVRCMQFIISSISKWNRRSDIYYEIFFSYSRLHFFSLALRCILIWVVFILCLPLLFHFTPVQLPFLLAGHSHSDRETIFVSIILLENSSSGSINWFTDCIQCHDIGFCVIRWKGRRCGVWEQERERESSCRQWHNRCYVMEWVRLSGASERIERVWNGWDGLAYEVLQCRRGATLRPTFCGFLPFS